MRKKKTKEVPNGDFKVKNRTAEDENWQPKRIEKPNTRAEATDERPTIDCLIPAPKRLWLQKLAEGGGEGGG